MELLTCLSVRWNDARPRHPGRSQSWAYGINNLGHVVGYSQTGTVTYTLFCMMGRCMTWHACANWSSYAYGINDLGHIVGEAAINTGGLSYAFLHDGTMHGLGTLEETTAKPGASTTPVMLSEPLTPALAATVPFCMTGHED